MTSTDTGYTPTTAEVADLYSNDAEFYRWLAETLDAAYEVGFDLGRSTGYDDAYEDITYGDCTD